jgi:excisionase family DNA binding protein
VLPSVDDAPVSSNAFLARWGAAIEQVAEELKIEPADPAVTPVERLNADFLAFLRATSQFGIFRFGPVTIHLAPVEQAVLASLGKVKLRPDEEFDAGLTRLIAAEKRRRGGLALDELHVLLAFMRIGIGVPADVFGELGVTPEQVEAYAAAPEEQVTDKLEPLYSPEEAARYLKVHVQTVREWIRSGHLPAFRLAGQKSFRIAARDLRKVLQPFDVESKAGRYMGDEKAAEHGQVGP